MSTTTDINFDDAQQLSSAYGKLVSIGDGSTAKRNSKTDFRTSVVGRLTGIRTDQKYSKPDAPKRLYDIITDSGESITVTDSAALRAITSECVGNVIRILFTGYGDAKPGQEPPKRIEVRMIEWASLTPEQQARFRIVEQGDSHEGGLS